MPPTIHNAVKDIRTWMAANPGGGRPPNIGRYGIFAGLFYRMAQKSLQAHPPAVAQPTQQAPTTPAAPNYSSPSTMGQADNPYNPTTQALGRVPPMYQQNVASFLTNNSRPFWQRSGGMF